MKNKTLETTLEKVSRIISHKYGMQVVFEGDSCETDGDTIYLPSLPEDVPNELLGAIRGWCDHEVAHSLYTETDLGPEFHEKHGRRAFAILNCLEDGRVERRLAEDYPGSAINLDEAFRFVEDRAEETGSEPDLFGQFTSALYTRAAGRPDQDWISGEAYSMADRFSEEIAAVRKAESTQEVAEAALDIWERVKNSVEEKQDGAGQSQPSDPDSPEGEEASEPETADESGDDRQRPPDSGQSGQGTGTSEKPPQKGDSPMESLSSYIEGEAEQAYGGKESRYRVYTYRHDTVEVPELKDDFDYRAEMEELSPYISGVRRRLLQTLLGRQKVRWLRDRGRGKLDPRALHRLASRSSPKVFRKRRGKKGGGTACTLLLDVSASMRGEQIDLCRKLALVFAETLATLGFPTEIIAFSTVDKDLRYEIARKTGVSEEELSRQYARLVPLYHGLFKQFGEPWKRAARRLGSLRSQCLTPLGESLLFTAKRLCRRPERRKVLFCLTDGKPVTGAWDEQVTFDHAHDSVREVTRSGIEPVGIGIQEGCVEDLFPRSAVIYELEQLPKAFLSELCDVLAGR